MLRLKYFPLFFFMLIAPAVGSGYERNDLLGNDSLCRQILVAREAGEISCASYFPQDELEISVNALDEHLALAEIKRNIVVMAEAQVQSSLLLLKKLGMKSPSKSLQEKLRRLEEKGIMATPVNSSISEDLLQRYLIAALRYQELTSQMANNIFKAQKRELILDKIKLLELKYPLIAQHNFKYFKDSVCQKAGLSTLAKKESKDEEALLDQYLFDEKELKKSSPHSYTGKISQLLLENKNDFLPSSELIKELEISFSNQLTPLLNLDAQKECDLWNLHGSIALQVINSSARPEKMFGKACECQQTHKPISHEIVTGLEVASLGGLGLCLTPTGVGQVLGCPGAMIAGLGAGGANTINFVSSVAQAQTIQDQKSIVAFLERTNLQKEEQDYLRKKEIEIIKDAGVDTITGLIGLGVGHIGAKNLIKYFQKGKLATSLKRLSDKEAENLIKAMEELDDVTQTRAFVVLEKLDQDSRETLLKKPAILLRELKKNGGFCEL